MATSPQFPPENQPEQRDIHEVPRLQVPPKKEFPWLLISLGSAAAILIVILVMLPRAPKARPSPTAAQVPAQPTPGEIQLSHLKLTAVPTGDAYYLDGLLFNNGNTNITAVQVKISFKGANGEIAGEETKPVGEIVGSSGASATDVAQAPIKPSDSKPIRIYLDHPPANWNKQLPEVTVTTVTAVRP